MTKYLPKQWLRGSIEIHQIDRTSNLLSECGNEFYFFIGTQGRFAKNRQVQIAVRTGMTAGDRTKHNGEMNRREARENASDLIVNFDFDSR